MSNVYIIRQADTDLYKVGYTNRDPKQRLSELQIGNGAILEYASLIECSNPQGLEHFIHQKLTRQIPQRQRHVHGEWFEISESWLKTILFELATRDKDVYPELGIIRKWNL